MEKFSPNADGTDDSGLNMAQYQSEKNETEQADTACSFTITDEGEQVWKLMKNCDDDYVVDTTLFAEQWATNILEAMSQGDSFEASVLQAANKAKAEMEAESWSRPTEEMTSEVERSAKAPIISSQMQGMAARLLERYWDGFGRQLYQEYMKTVDNEGEKDMPYGSTGDISY